MKHILILIIVLRSLDIFSQCAGLNITTQQAIDDFQQNYPGCTSISGDLIITGSSIQNLNGLSQLTSISGLLKVQNTYINNFIGLNNLLYIGGNFEIRNNPNLLIMDGMSSLQTIGGNYRVLFNPQLVNFTGLNSITAINGILDIQSNSVLYNFNGLESLSIIGNGIRISGNNNLHTLDGINNLTNFNGSFSITTNTNLTDISALGNIVSSQITSLSISNNHLLEVCNISPICTFLSNPIGKIIIYGNAPGCYNSYAIANSCGIQPMCLPYGDYYIRKQSDVDNFHTYYPDCTDLNGLLFISGTDILNLNGLLGITSVSDNLWIERNELLINLKGLDSLHYVGGELEVGFYDIYSNNALNSLTGLENLDTVNKALLIGQNMQLVNLDPLSSLEMVGDSIAIYLNPLLTSISGISGINSDSLLAINIQYNPLLSNCSIESVCNYLNLPESVCYIHSNAEGCQTRQEIEDDCLVNTEFIKGFELYNIYPNPVSEYLVIQLNSPQANFVLYNILGEKLSEGHLSMGQNILSVFSFESGVYVLNVNIDENNYRTKIIKTN